ncbi:unnamed protein product [Orchesella dallaii]|uniref:Protein quiver n=1 Tax=Orchesella dallaii TaxID=48710 RepID=A0ABP1PJK4_9HEXA
MHLHREKVGSLSLVFILMILDPTSVIKCTEGLLCYRCDSMNQGETCDMSPATGHLRNYLKDEPCLSFEEANRQYLSVQKYLDIEWYFSARNGDLGLPLHFLLENNSVPVAVHDKDSACLVVRSIFHHDYLSDDSVRQDPPFILWFRKCVRVPTIPVYPLCVSTPIYKGEVQLCVCRTDKCNTNQRRILLLGQKSFASTINSFPISFILLLFQPLILLLKSPRIYNPLEENYFSH